MAGGIHAGRGICGGGEGVQGCGVCMAGGAWQGHAWLGVMRDRRDSHCSRQYTFYWNAFLFNTYTSYTL